MDKALRVKNVPLIVRKGNIAFIRTSYSKDSMPVKIQSLYKEDVLFETTDVHFLKGEYQKLRVINRSNIVNKFITTVAKFFNADGSVLEKTSDRVTTLIGQEEYKTVFSGLCSIIDQNLKIRSILALLTSEGKKVKSISNSEVGREEKCCQTDEMRIEPLRKQRRRIRKKPSPYIVKDFKAPEPKRVRKVIVQIPNTSNSVDYDNIINVVKIESVSPVSNPEKSAEGSEKSPEISEKSPGSSEKNSEDSENHPENSEKVLKIEKSVETCTSNCTDEDSSMLPELLIDDEYSNDSVGNYSALSVDTTPDLMSNPMSICVDRHTKDNRINNIVENYIVQNTHTISVMDGNNVRNITLQCKPEDDLHIATAENLQLLDDYSKKLLIKHQMFLDLKHCLTIVDDDGNLPIHLAVINNDIELVRRQCIVLKIKNRSVDVPANGLSPLKMSLYQESIVGTTLLLKFGADILQVDTNYRTPIHLAAELKTDHLKVLLNHCRDHARNILSESEYWKEEMEKQTDEELVKFLLKRVCTAVDKQGYTPLMLASLLGIYDNVRLLLELAPDITNYQMPTSGNTALYLACDAASNCSTERGNKSKVEDHYQKTIEILIENGADPTIDNYSGSNVNALLAEFNCPALSLLISNKLTKCNFKKNSIIVGTDDKIDKIMLIKSDTGTVNIKALHNEKLKKTRKKPVQILENILIKKPINLKSTKTSESTPNTKDSAEKVNVKKVIINASPDKNLKRKMAAPVAQIKIVKK